jgi:2-deoxy-D-gluconate 3-dehydrogenase
MVSIFDLTGKTAVVTGARKGIGFGIASILAEYGANIIAVSSQQGSGGKEIENVVRGFGRNFHGITCDFSKRSEVTKLSQELSSEKIEILVNNAGLANRNVALEHSDSEWDQILEVDLSAPFILSRELARGMTSRGYGKIVNIASMWSYLGGVNVISYTAAKTAIVGLTRGLSNEWIGSGVNVNAIAPGFIETDINNRVRADKPRFDFISSRIPAKRWGKPADLAGAALFLCSPASDYVSGIVIPVDGGYLAN